MLKTSIQLQLVITAFCLALVTRAAESVRSWEGSLTIPTYEHSGRETEPPLFANSSVTGMYPFTTYLLPFKPDGPRARTYKALFVENEYLKLTYVPEVGGRIFSVYDKLRSREMFYRNDVIKPAPYNPRMSWVQSGLELTGPHDLHMLTLHGEPFWANQILKHADGSVSLVVGEVDPVYGMKVNLTATLHPGIAALEIGVSCYNARDARMPQMLWINTAISATPKTRFIYPMTRTVGHTTADIADWPVYNGVDLSWDRNNKNMLGVFGIDIYDNFQGAYQFDLEYGIFRFADRRNVQGMKLWTFGYGPGAKNHERGYTDNAGPYVELQSGRYVWDGHYEWVAPHKTESWSEWWIPVAKTRGLTTLTRDIALNIERGNTGSRLVFAATRTLPSVQIEVNGANKTADLGPAVPFEMDAPASGAVSILVRDKEGRTLLAYQTPEGSPGRKEYTPFTRPLEKPRAASKELTVEELLVAAEFKFKELDAAGARALLKKALTLDPEYSRAHLLLGIDDLRDGRPRDAIPRLEKAIERDPYADEAYYYLAMAQFAGGLEPNAERNLYFIGSDSAHYGEREYHLGRLAMLRRLYDAAVANFERAVAANARDLLARHALAIAHRKLGNREAAAREIAALESADPTSRGARAERWFLSGESGAKAELLRLLGGQSQEAIAESIVYRNLGRWDEAARILVLVQEKNADPWGTPPEFWYTLAYCQKRAGDAGAAAQSRNKARAAAANIDRFPYRQESEEPLVEAVEIDSSDVVARFALGCLLYSRNRHDEAIKQWNAAALQDPKNFSVQRALGLAKNDAAYLERAVELNPAHLRTRNDLSNLYARAGLFDKQQSVLEKALAQAPEDDDLTEALAAVHLAQGQYAQADRIILAHRFAPRHRSYSLREKYRLMRYAMAGEAYRRRDYAAALRWIDSAGQLPESLGMDDFAGQATPRHHYYRGRVLEALDRAAEARRAYENSIAEIDRLTSDRDSWSAENFFAVRAFRRLGQADRAAALKKRFETFALKERDARGLYLLALIRIDDGRAGEARDLLRRALEKAPDFLPARLEERGHVPDDPLPNR